MVLDKEKGWTSNKPTVADVLKAWVPPTTEADEQHVIRQSVLLQDWKGLAFKDFGPKKGTGTCTCGLQSDPLLTL